jgi:hypothetical protein
MFPILSAASLLKDKHAEMMKNTQKGFSSFDLLFGLVREKKKGQVSKLI